MQGINTLLTGLASLLQNMEIQDPGTSRQFTVGEKLAAQVLSKEGDNYLVQAGTRLFRAQSDLSLNPGDKLVLYVSEQKDGRTLLKVQQTPAPSKEPSSQGGQIQQPQQAVPAQFTILKPAALSQPVLESNVAAQPGMGTEPKAELMQGAETVPKPVPKQEDQEFWGETKLLPGRVIDAVVQGRKGQLFLVEAGQEKYFLEGDTELKPGERLQLLVKEELKDRVILERIGPKPLEQEPDLEQVRRLAAKYGFVTEKEISQLAEQLDRLPVDEKTGVRYLLDPHLAAAVIIPPQAGAERQSKIEIEQYKESSGRQQVWEVSFAVSLANLGPLEIMLKMIEGRIYTRIWAEKTETEALLRSRQGELLLQTAVVEIVPAAAGPLIPQEANDVIDLRV